MKRTRCPYCGKRLNYFQAFAKRKQGEHICKGCGRNSTIYFSTAYKAVVGVTIVLAAILVIIFTNPYFIQNLWGMLFVALPFLVLYLITPFFLRLIPIKKHKTIKYKTNDNETANTNNDDFIKDVSDNSKTKIIDKIDLDDNEEFDISNIDIYKE